MLFGVGVSCRILYFVISYLCVSCNGSFTSLSFTCYVVSFGRAALFKRDTPWAFNIIISLFLPLT